MKGQRGKKRMEKCVTKEEWCCYCYIGGLLLFCDQKDCVKTCHPQCIGKDDSFANSGNSWTCDAHSCFICKKGQDFKCVGCPKALCRRCIGQVEFAQIKGSKGICRICLNFALLVEEKKDAEFDKQLMENFGSAWEIISDRASLTLKDLRCVEERMNKGKFYMSGCGSEETDGVKSERSNTFSKKKKAKSSMSACDSEKNDEGVKSGRCDKFPNKERRCITPQLQYALIDPKNITLVYLKKRLVEKLVKEPRTVSDEKLIGSFVKIKADRNDRFDNNIFKLLQVTGTTWTHSGENDPDILLHVSGMENQIGINLLSNGAVNEYECKDLKIRIQRGLLKQPTVDELEHKATILHEDITKHWITTELERLQIRFELAYERGWRREMIEFETQRDCLLKSDEQEKLLNTILHVVAAAQGELELLTENDKDVQQEDKRCSKTPCPNKSCSGNQAVLMGCSTSSNKHINIGSNDVGIGGNHENVAGKVKDSSNYLIESIRRLDRGGLKTYSRRKRIATLQGEENVHLKTNPVAELDNDNGKLAEDNMPSMDEQLEAILLTLDQS